MILAVTGGRHRAVTVLELRALWTACSRRGVRELRVGCCPTGVDAAVWEAAKGLSSRMFAIERWVADWDKHGNAAGPMRNRGMARGDPRLVALVEGATHPKDLALTSRGHVDACVHWPGGRGTMRMVEEATRAGARWVLPIADLMEPTHG